MRDRLFWGEALALMLEAYLEFLISGFLNSQEPLFTTSGEVVAAVIGYMSLFFTILVMPSVFIWILRRPLETLKNKNFE